MKNQPITTEELVAHLLRQANKEDAAPSKRIIVQTELTARELADVIKCGDVVRPSKITHKPDEEVYELEFMADEDTNIYNLINTIDYWYQTVSFWVEDIA